MIIKQLQNILQKKIYQNVIAKIKKDSRLRS